MLKYPECVMVPIISFSGEQNRLPSMGEFFWGTALSGWSNRVFCETNEHKTADGDHRQVVGFQFAGRNFSEILKSNRRGWV